MVDHDVQNGPLKEEEQRARAAQEFCKVEDSMEVTADGITEDALVAPNLDQVGRKHKEMTSKQLRHQKDTTERKLRQKFRAKRERLKAIFREKTARLERKLKTGYVVRLKDKYAFTLGIVNMLVTQLILVRFPEHMHLWYTFWVFPLMLLRYLMYAKNKWQYFMLDFCYFVQLLLVLYLYAFPKSSLLFHIIFSSSNGPLAWAIPLWRNSLVFHDIDKTTSLFIHSFPPLVTFCLRWWQVSPHHWAVCYDDECSFDLVDALVIPTVAYVIWQVIYSLKVDVLDRPKLSADPDIQTSFRWLTADSKGWINKWCCKYGQKYSLLMYIALQFAYTVVSMTPTVFFFHFFWLHSAFLIGLFLRATWNGANYYFEKFAREYEQSLRSLDPKKHDGPVDPVPTSKQLVVPDATKTVRRRLSSSNAAAAH